MPNFSRFTNPVQEEPDYELLREIEEIKGDMKLDLEKGDEALAAKSRWKTKRVTAKPNDELRHGVGNHALQAIGQSNEK